MTSAVKAEATNTKPDASVHVRVEEATQRPFAVCALMPRMSGVAVP